MQKNILYKVHNLFFSVQFGKFLAVGGTAAIANYCSGWMMRSLYPSLLNEVSVVIGYTVGTIISFIFNKLFTFKAVDEKTSVQALKFLVVAFTAALLGAGISRLVLIIFDGIDISVIDRQIEKNISHIFAIGITTIYNFLAMKYFSFKKITITNRNIRPLV